MTIQISTKTWIFMTVAWLVIAYLLMFQPFAQAQEVYIVGPNHQIEELDLSDGQYVALQYLQFAK